MTIETPREVRVQTQFTKSQEFINDRPLNIVYNSNIVYYLNIGYSGLAFEAKKGKPVQSALYYLASQSEKNMSMYLVWFWFGFVGPGFCDPDSSDGSSLI